MNTNHKFNILRSVSLVMIGLISVAEATRALTSLNENLTRYGWNFPVIFYGIIPSNQPPQLGTLRQKRNHATSDVIPSQNQRPEIFVKKYMSDKIGGADSG
jgi:hypothetical protein